METTSNLPVVATNTALAKCSDQSDAIAESTALAKGIVQPVSKSTLSLFRPIHFAANDRLRISLTKDAKHFELKFYALMRDGSHTRPSSMVRQFICRIPERKMLDQWDNRWQVAGTDFTAILINALWDSKYVAFTDEARILYEFLLTRFIKQTQNSRTRAAYKLERVMPDMPKDFLDHPVRPLMSFQKVGLVTQLYEEGTNLWMEQGTGKTPIIISRICHQAHKLYQKEKRMYRALVVVPKNMRMNWHNKFLDFATRPGKITVLRGGKIARVKLLIEAFKPDDDSEYTVVVCSYDSVIRSWSAMKMIHWDLCVLDEAHMIKDSFTKRWAKMKELRENCDERTGLTGTPIANHLFDTYTQLEWLGEGLSGFSSYKNFKSYYGKFVRRDNSQFDTLVGYKNLPILQERIARLCFMITREEAMPELPQKTYDTFEVTMSKFQCECYIKLQKQLAIEIEAEMAGGQNKQLTVNHILTKLLRLSQITAGYLKWDAQFDDVGNVVSGGVIEEIDSNPKIDAVVELLKSKKPTEKTIIWTNWVTVIKMLSRRLTKEGIRHVTYYGATSDDDRQLAQDSYNMNPAVKVFIGNPAAGGVGLDLWGHIPEWDGTDKDHGCNTTQEIYFSQDWSMIHRSQSEDRAVRRGTRVSVQITDLIVPNTIDEEIAIRVLNKKISAIQLQDIKSIMARLLVTIPSADDD